MQPPLLQKPNTLPTVTTFSRWSRLRLIRTDAVSLGSLFRPGELQIQGDSPLTFGIVALMPCFERTDSRHDHPRRVTDCATIAELFEHCLPAFGGASLRRIYSILDRAIGAGSPLTLAIAGPVTASGQHLSWLIPLIETGWIASVSTTDAVCYHDGHRSLPGYRNEPITELSPVWSDGLLRQHNVVRLADLGINNSLLVAQDQFLYSLLSEPEFQRRMTGTEFRYMLGARFAAQEQRTGAPVGLLATCHRMAIPVLVGAPSDGSIFLDTLRHWVRCRAGLGGVEFRFDLDLHAEVFESCAYHHWALSDNPPYQLGTLILGGGVPKNYNLQPQPMLNQGLGIKSASGFTFDVQIVSSPSTDGSLSSCAPSEAVTWGKVDPSKYETMTETLQADYSLIMPFLVKALLDNRERFARLANMTDPELLFKQEPKAAGYLRSVAGYRLFANRDELCNRLLSEVRESGLPQ